MIRTLKLCRWPLPVLTMLLAFSTTYALNQNRMMSQYVRERWNVDRGLPSGHVLAIAQTADGYLWIGTDNGLVRFDGFGFQAVSFLSVGLPSNSPVLGLITDAEGSLVIRLAGAVGQAANDKGFDGLDPRRKLLDVWGMRGKAQCLCRRLDVKKAAAHAPLT